MHPYTALFLAPFLLSPSNAVLISPRGNNNDSTEVDPDGEGSPAWRKRNLLTVKSSSTVAGVVTCPSNDLYLRDIHGSAITTDDNALTLNIDASNAFQSIDGFGYTLTGGSAQHLMGMKATARNELLQELFGDIKISTLRISVGASDLDPDPYSLAEEPDDMELQQFSMQREMEYKIPLLNEILAINPEVRLLATPWSAPYWMKDNRYTIGGSLLHGMFGVYATYLVKYLQAMEKYGLPIHALSIQNEALNHYNNPSMYMTSYDCGLFIKNHLAPALTAANLTPQLIIYDHNADEPLYATDLLDDPDVKRFVAGSAFHLYAGTIDALSTVHQKHPDRDVHFTEQYTSADGEFESDFMWHAKNIWIGSLNNWAKTVLEWNLSSNSALTPHTPGGCTKCLGAITIDGDVVSQRNIAYYMVAHAAPFIPRGAVRVGSSLSGGDSSHIHHVALQLPNGKITVLFAYHYWEPVVVRLGGEQVTLPGRSLVTLQF